MLILERNGTVQPICASPRRVGFRWALRWRMPGKLRVMRWWKLGA